MSESPTQFVSLYSEALLLLVPLDEVAKDVFLVLCKHVDVLGFCHPGDDLLGRLSCHRRDAVPGALECLQAANYIHVIETAVPYRAEPLRDIQISPYIMRLRPEFHSTAVQRWESFIPLRSAERAGESYSASNENRSPSITSPSSDRGSITYGELDRGSITYGENDRQPDQIQNKIQNPIQNQLQNQITLLPPPSHRSSSASGADQPQPPFEGEEQKPGQGQMPGLEADPTTRRVPTSNASAVPSSAAPLREPPTLLHFKHPLPTLEDEALALDLIRAAGDLSLENARMLIDTYGRERVGMVIQIFYRSKSISQPASWIRAMLRKTDVEFWKGQMKQ